jgi:sugar phosphate isomerase/epimerase
MKLGVMSPKAQAVDAAARGTPSLRFGVSTFGFLYRCDLADAFRAIAAAGYRQVEIAASAPHLNPASASSAERGRVRALLEETGLHCVSINPTELNLISPNPDIRNFALRSYLASIQMCAELDADIQMIIPGRQNSLVPMPIADALGLLDDQLEALLKEAHTAGVTLALETVPFGFIQSTSEVAAVVRRINDERLGIALDCANTFSKEDVGESVRLAGSDLRMAQFSDAWKSQWAHTSIGRGEINFDEFRAALVEIGYSGACVYELADDEDPCPRIADDLQTLSAAGWSS